MEKTCKKCGSVFSDYKTEDRIISNGTMQRKASCPECGAYIKFLPHTEPKMYFGKFKGETLSWIAENHRWYLTWLLTTNIKNNLRENVEKALNPNNFSLRDKRKILISKLRQAETTAEEHNIKLEIDALEEAM